MTTQNASNQHAHGIFQTCPCYINEPKKKLTCGKENRGVKLYKLHWHLIQNQPLLSEIFKAFEYFAKQWLILMVGPLSYHK